MCKRPYIPFMLTILAGLALAASAAAGPVATERIPVTDDSRPFFAANIDLAAHGYVEDEYLLTGTGDVYEYEADNVTLRVQSADVPYTTRILVRRPAKAKDFNGVAMVELLNPTAGFDIDFEWHYTSDLLLAEGYAWVGITMKDVAIDALKGWNPERYGALSMPDRGLAYAMLGQVAALVRDRDDSHNPLAGYNVEHVIATGYSQSADYLTTFSNEFHDLARARDGGHAIDGYLHAGGAATARRINSSDPEFYVDHRAINRVDAPLIRVQSETELAIFTYASPGVRQPDSDVFRVYEVAGSSHADGDLLDRTGAVMERDFGGPSLPVCDNPLSPLAIGPVHRSSLAHLTQWIVHGWEPPPSVLIDYSETDGVARDSLGNALGGIRLPAVAAPLGQLSPTNPGPGLCILSGAFAEFDEATRDQLYPTHGEYFEQVVAASWHALLSGHVRIEDAARYIWDAWLLGW